MTFGSALVVLAWFGAHPAAGQDGPVSEEPVQLDGVEESVSEAPPPVEEGPDSEGAPTEPDLSSVAERLLGDAPDPSSARVDRSSEPLLLPDTPSWMWPVGLLMLAAIVALRWQTQRAPDPADRLRVIQRVALGREGHLALVEVGDDDDKRRLLIGYGAGAPRLVAELDVPEVATASPRPESTSSAPAAQRWQRALGRLGLTPTGAPTTSAGRLPGSGGRQTADQAEDPPGRTEARLRPRRSLVEEVLAEREPAKGGGDDVAEVPRPSAPSTRSPSAASQEEPSDEQADRETYTFRGLIG